jgi:peptide deformylase
VAEQAAVNRLVVGSNPTRGVYMFCTLIMNNIYAVFQNPHDGLKRVACTVSDFSSSLLQQQIHNMLMTLSKAKGCAALASTQLNIEHLPFSVVVFNPCSEFPFKEPTPIVNLNILEYSETTIESSEGCMSFRAMSDRVIIHRADTVTFEGYTPTGQRIEQNATGFFSCCIQHEYDHLQGITFFQRFQEQRPEHYEHLEKRYKRAVKYAPYG